MKKLNVVGCLCLVFLMMSVFETVGQDMNNDQKSQSSVSIKSTDQTDIVYRNPRPFNVTYFAELIPDPTKIDRTKDLKLWLSIPREWDSQKAVKILSVDPPAHATYEDPEYGNRMLFWDFGKEPEKVSYKVEVKFRLESYEAYAEVDPERVETYDKTSDEYVLYTRSEHTICITPKVKELAQEAVGDEKNPYLQAKRIFEFVHMKMRY
jgi:transglutaminase-like putative cysteine protease